MGENLDNIFQQTEEMETLTSIYGNQWKIDDKTVPEYPSNSLPTYELLAPKLTSKQKQMIDEEFNNIFRNGDGGPLIYQMILAVKEVASQRTNSEQNCQEDMKVIKDTEENDLTENFIMKKSDEVTKLSVLNIIHGPVIEDRKSAFQGHVCTVNSKEDVSNFMQTLLENRKIAHATHNISAYRISLPNNVVLQDCDDDGENRASGRLLELLQHSKLDNVMVVVSRWFGGILLGPDRFRHINNAARQALIAAGHIKL